MASVDAIVADVDKSTIWFNDGHGKFANSLKIFPDLENTPVTVDEARTVVLGDLDGDGDLDACLIWLMDFGGTKILKNDGTGHFQSVQTLPSVYSGTLVPRPRIDPP
ncbi:MAG: FG-GAP-like repeat-containing protein [Planctomycetia bacterium]|nr:FG-GAP-like repeat-containing protein [Planctomycetia bacterium]